MDPELAVIIGDFGLGSDSPIILDYAQNPSNSPVRRLRRRSRGHGNEWVTCAFDFDEFAKILGLA
jgi:hypothetical protein